MRKVLSTLALVVVCVLIAVAIQLVFGRESASAATVSPGYPTSRVVFSRPEVVSIAGKREYWAIGAGACGVLPKPYAIACAATVGFGLVYIGRKFTYARNNDCRVRMTFAWLMYPPFQQLTNVSVTYCPWQRGGSGSW